LLDSIQLSNTASAVPEPSTLALGGSGVLTLAGYAWRRRRRRAAA
jgi:PEP-CTERM motif